MNRNRPGPTLLVIAGISYLFLDVLIQALFTLTGVNIGTLPFIGWLYWIVFDLGSFNLLLVYWMTMRRVGTNRKTWVIPMAMMLAALSIRHLTWLTMPMLIGSISLSNLLLYLLTIAMLEGLNIWLSASILFLLSQAIGVYLVPIHQGLRQSDAVEWRSVVRAIVGVNVTLLVVLFCFSPSQYYVWLLPGIFSSMSTACLWFGLATLVAYGFQRQSAAGLICLIVALSLSVATYPLALFLQQGLNFRGLNPQQVLLSYVLLTLKWVLFHWLLHSCGYRLATRSQIEMVLPPQETEGQNRSVEKIDSEPVQQWII